ncbi:5918_t:CDS:2 [Ambispora gerdemannii]|uniref:5918_t:CDS:1 n=1 Tax=Ambispora gerdemannii TaxID=144530 RepID=A0A9N9C374_9GLOM|nr:5918_t:CDS:2 [Ambispora gerdemannii]
MSSAEDHISVIVDYAAQGQPVDNSDSNELKSSSVLAYPYPLPVSENIAKELFGELFDDPDEKFNQDILLWLQKTCFVLAGLYTSNLKPKEETYDRYVMHLIIMTRFVLKNSNKARTSDFIKFYNLQPESKEYPLGEAVGTYYINYVFCSLLNISKAEDENVLFENLVYSAFPYGRNVLSHKQKNIGPLPSINRSIDLSMDKMKNFLLDFEVTTYFNEHFELKGHKVSICSYEFDRQELMVSYMHNRVAQLYGIEMAGMEILKTFTFLIDNKESKDIMRDYDIWRGAGGLEEAVFKLNYGRTKSLGYTLLADKFFRFERKINSFWFRFQRETNHRRLYKPVDYYFVVFSIFLGLLTIVQTISGIVSLIFQLKS